MPKTSKPKSACGPARRDARGCFIRGASGNPHGRPVKLPPPAWSLPASFQAALDESASLRRPDGSIESISARDLLVKSVVHNGLKAKPKDQLYLLERLSQLGALEPVPEVQERWPSEEDRRVLEIIERNLEPPLCTGCAKPIDATDSSPPITTQFGWG